MSIDKLEMNHCTLFIYQMLHNFFYVELQNLQL